MGKVIAAYRNHPYHLRPIPQEIVGGWVNMTQPQISKIENGPKIQDLSKLIHWALTLRIPERLLWFRLPLTEGHVLDSTALWVPVGLSLGLPDDEIVPAMPDGMSSELQAVTLPHSDVVIAAPGESTLAAAWQATLDRYIAIDNLFGPGAVLSAVPRQAAFVRRLIATGGGDRSALLDVAARYAEFAGWLYQDSGHPRMAMRWTDRALELAEAAEDVYLVSYIWMRKSNIGTDATQPELALRFAGAAMRNASQLAPRIRAVAYRQEAQAHALAGDADACARALDSAREQVGHGEDEAVIAQYCTAGYVEMEAAHCWVELGYPDRAVSVLRQGLAPWQPEFRRDLGLGLARLAVAYAYAEAPHEAIDVARQAVAILRQTRSHRTRVQLDRATNRLASIGVVDAAEDLRHMLAALH